MLRDNRIRELEQALKAWRCLIRKWIAPVAIKKPGALSNPTLKLKIGASKFQSH